MQAPALPADVEYVTGRPELAIAASTYGAPPTTGAGGGGDVNEIDCTLSDGTPLPTENDCCTRGAARWLAFPG